MTYNRNYHGPAKFIDRGTWVDYHPTGAPKSAGKPTPWHIIAHDANAHLRQADVGFYGDDDPIEDHDKHELFVDILPEAWR